MLFTLAAFLLPPLLVFSAYHLLTWFNPRIINERSYWTRVAVASAISHVVLVTGFFVFAYVDYQEQIRLESIATGFGPFLFDRSEFWRLMTIFDTAPMLVILGLFSMLDWMGVNPPGLLIATFGITYLVGTLQWFWIGGGIGALLQRFWAGLKAGDEEDSEWM